jgi:sugar phosphate isomerase/epimerase
MKELLDFFRSPALKVIYDPVNLIPSAGLGEEPQAAFFNRAFDAFGEHIAAIHLKDFRMENGKKTGDLLVGTGSLDCRTLFALLRRKKPDIDILLENSVPARAHETMALLNDLYYAG